MNIVFFGTSEFGVVVLEKLVQARLPDGQAGYKPVLVVTTADKPAGRNLELTPPPVKALIAKHETWNVPLLQPEKLDSSFTFQVSRFTPDLFVVASYGEILPKE